MRLCIGDSVMAMPTRGRCIEEPKPYSARELLETIIEHCGYRTLEERKWTSYGYMLIVYVVSAAKEQYRSIGPGRLDKLPGFYPRTLEESIAGMLAAADQMDAPQAPDSAMSS